MAAQWRVACAPLNSRAANIWTDNSGLNRILNVTMPLRLVKPQRSSPSQLYFRTVRGPRCSPIPGLMSNDAPAALPAS